MGRILSQAASSTDLVRLVAFPTPNNTETVRAVIDTLDIQNLKDGLAKFTSFRTRCESRVPTWPAGLLTGP